MQYSMLHNIQHRWKMQSNRLLSGSRALPVLNSHLEFHELAPSLAGSRQQFLVRKGCKGEGSNKAFRYGGDVSKSEAKADAEKLVKTWTREYEAAK